MRRAISRVVSASGVRAPAMLKTNHVSFSYRPRGRRVLDDVSIEIERGAVVGLLGPNGSGKTTLLKILAGVLTPDAGEVFLEGAPVRTLSRRQVARHLAVVPQETHATFDFTVLDIVLMRGTRRIPHVRVRRPDVPVSHPAGDRRDSRTRRIRLYGPHARLNLLIGSFVHLLTTNDPLNQ